MKSIPPLRLRDDPRAPPLARGDLARAAQVTATTFDAARGLAAFEAAIGQGSVVAPPPQTPGVTQTLAGAIAKGAICGLVAVGAAGLVSVLGDARGRAPMVMAPGVPATMPAQASVEEPLTKVTSPRTEPTPDPPARPVTSPLAQPAPPAVTRPPAGPPQDHQIPDQADHVRADPPDPAPVARASDLQLEMELLARLRALEPSDPQQALALAEEGQRRFSSGFFAQERETLAISALVRLGRRAEAGARARAFLSAYPKSHFVERIRELTGN